MVDFGELWDSVVLALQNSSAILGVPKDKIQAGFPEVELKSQPPFIYALCLPADKAVDDLSGSSQFSVADITIFAGVHATESIVTTIVNCVNLCGKIAKVLDADGSYSRDDTPPQLEAKTSSFAMMSVTYQAIFQLYEV